MKKQPTPGRKNPTFRKVMTQARTHMNPIQKAWSSIIHARGLDTVASLLGSTLMRPLPLLCGAIFSSLTVILFYGTAKAYGYSLSGAEGIAGFLFGWTVGLMIDLLRAMLRGGR